MIENSNDKTNFLHKILLNDTKVLKIRKAFANGSSTNIKFSKTRLSKMIQSGEFNFFHFFDLIDPKIYGTGITLADKEIKDIN